MRKFIINITQERIQITQCNLEMIDAYKYFGVIIDRELLRLLLYIAKEKKTEKYFAADCVRQCVCHHALYRKRQLVVQDADNRTSKAQSGVKSPYTYIVW